MTGCTIPPIATPWTARVGPDNALPEYPRPQLTRDRWQNLNGVWQFARATAGQAVPAGQSLAERVLVPYPIESALSGIQRREDRMFEVDVTDALSGTGERKLILWAEDLTDATGQPIGKQRRTGDRGIFYQGSSGIWRTVWMEPVPASSITGLQMTPDLEAGVLRLTVDVEGREDLQVRATARGSGTVAGKIQGASGTELALPVPRAELWSPDSPYLYNLDVQLLDGRTVVDRVGSYFGMRSIGTKPGEDGKLRLALNGEILFHMAMSFAGVWALGPAKPEVGRWYHLVGVRDTVNGELRLYIDGEQAGRADACLPQGAPTGNTVIGRGRFGGNPVDYLDGTADQVHLYDRMLSADEIRSLYSSGD
ncbi:hypothetical protein OHA21_21880 [Actinoplanes sp. NBC_00393]|uniref:LamG-like jellyroll fold domain-containing protein n=1 Tax=Actinoplanes sp. NBC_00393 TaxID=2975953 RepID=UPI002E23C5B3